MKTEHTRGPWEIAGPRIVGAYRTVCTIYYGAGDGDERQANALLIAAAPDLLAVCGLAYTALVQHAQNGMAISSLPELIDRLELALGKADAM